MEKLKLEIKGKITKILTVEKGTAKSGKDFVKQNFVIDTGEKFNPEVCFQMFGEEKCNNLTKFNKEGDEVVVSFNVSSREFNNKYYHNLDAWLIKKAEATAEVTTAKKASVEAPEDNLPF